MSPFSFWRIIVAYWSTSIVLEKLRKAVTMEPFFSSLNTLGIIALVISVGYTGLMAFLENNKKYRITLIAVGVPLAVIMSFGINYLPKGLHQGGINTMMSNLGTLFVGGLVALIAGGLWVATLGLINEFHKASKSSSSSSRTNNPSYSGSLEAVGKKYGLIAAMQGESECEGWYLIDHDNSGDPDPLLEASRNVDLEHERECGYLYGDPGSGLDSSSFDDTAVQSGQRGESNLAKIISYSKLEVISFWSLYGLNEERKPINADIDCVLAGIDSQHQVHAWFVDAKNYKGGSDTKYVNMDVKTLVRFSISQRALIKGADGKPYIHLTKNMAMQKANWQSTLTSYHIQAEWLICMTPAGHNGTPDVSEVTWPGGIRVVTPEQLVAEIRAIDLLPIDNIPQNVFEVFGSSVKMRAIREHKNVPLTPDVPRITQKTATPTATVAETAPQPAPASPATVAPNANTMQQPDEPEPAARPNYCPNCGQKLEETTNFCPNCGKPVA